MYKIDHYFAKNINVFYTFVLVLSFVIGSITAKYLSFSDLWQVIIIAGYPIGLLMGSKMQQYENFNKLTQQGAQNDD